MKRPLPVRGFTLIELIVTIAIIAMMASLFAPSVQTMVERSRSVTCSSNLRQIGVAVQGYIADHDGQFPYIEPSDSTSVYPEEEEGDKTYDAKPILERLGPYGVTEALVRCPADNGSHGRTKYYESQGSSYEWRPFLDGEEVAGPRVYGRRGTRTISKLSRFVICTDYDRFHFNRANRLYADGRAVPVLDR